MQRDGHNNSRWPAVAHKATRLVALALAVALAGCGLAAATGGATAVVTVAVGDHAPAWLRPRQPVPDLRDASTQPFSQPTRVLAADGSLLGTFVPEELYAHHARLDPTYRRARVRGQRGPPLLGSRGLRVWVGFPEGTIPMRGIDGVPAVTGGSFPALIWHDVLTAAHEGLPVTDFPSPPVRPRTDRYALTAQQDATHKPPLRGR